jgi:hypothetical protein
MGIMYKMKVFSFATCTFLTLVGLSSLYAGIGLIVHPDGSGLLVTVDALNHSPFNDFLLPGIILLVMIGIFSLTGAYLAFMNNQYSGIATMLLGIITLIWIFGQTFWSGWGLSHQPVFIIIGLAELSLGYHLIELYTENGGMVGNHRSSQSF